MIGRRKGRQTPRRHSPIARPPALHPSPPSLPPSAGVSFIPPTGTRPSPRSSGPRRRTRRRARSRAGGRKGGRTRKEGRREGGVVVPLLLLPPPLPPPPLPPPPQEKMRQPTNLSRRSGSVSSLPLPRPPSLPRPPPPPPRLGQCVETMPCKPVRQAPVLPLLSSIGNAVLPPSLPPSSPAWKRGRRA